MGIGNIRGRPGLMQATCGKPRARLLLKAFAGHRRTSTSCGTARTASRPCGRDYSYLSYAVR